MRGRLADVVDTGACIRTQAGIGGKPFAGGADHGQGGAKFVARIAGELAFALHEGADARDQVVQAAGEQPDLVVGEAGREVGRQPFRRRVPDGRRQSRERCGGPSRQPAADQQRERHGDRAGPGQQLQHLRPHRPDRQQTADLGDQPGAWRGRGRIQCAQVVMASLRAGELPARRLLAKHVADAVGQCVGPLHHVHEAVAWRGPAPMGGVVRLLRRGFALEQRVEQPVFDGVDEEQRVKAEQHGQQQREAGEHQHQPVAQPSTRQGGCAHASACRRKPTPCTVFSIGVANGLSSAWRSR